MDLPSQSDLAPEQLKPALEILRDTPPLPADFFRLCEFASGYYQAPLGEVLLQALPPGLKKARAAKRRTSKAKSTAASPAPRLPELTMEQAEAVTAVTGSRG